MEPLAIGLGSRSCYAPCGGGSFFKLNRGIAGEQLSGFLTTEPNGDAAPILFKAMSVILTTPDAIETWLAAPIAGALAVQRPLPDGIPTVL